MTSTSCEFLAQFLLDSCIAGNPPKRLPRALLEQPCAKALFGILVEGLADRFEPALCDVYAHLFSQAIAGQDPAALVARYDRVRRTRAVSWEPKRVLVLSRVTLGADVAVTSVLLAAAKQAFPKAEIVFVGPRKNFELFAADTRLSHAAVEYRRGSLHERLAVWDDLKTLAASPDCAGPRSRLATHPTRPAPHLRRSSLPPLRKPRYGGATDLNLPTLAAQWAQQTLAVSHAAPYVAVGQASGLSTPYIAVSLGVGENPAKRIPDPFEADLLALLSTHLPLVIDRGAGGEEAARVERAATQSGARATFWEGSFAGFAQVIAGSSLYVGYDSAGQHVAAACGSPADQHLRRLSRSANVPTLESFRPARHRNPRRPPRSRRNPHQSDSRAGQNSIVRCRL